MKIAHLILAHNNPDQLERLVDALQHPDAWIFVHLDAKTDFAPFQFLALKEHVFFIKKREKVSWGAYSIVQATVNGIEEIIVSKIGFNYVNLLSGADYPLRSSAGIHEFFNENNGANFMTFESVADEWQEAIPRLSHYHLTNYDFPGKYVIQKWLNKLMPARKMPAGLVPVGRSQWFSITMDAAEHLVGFLSSHPEVVRFFKLTWAPDEIIFHTILYNSRFRQSMVNNNLRYTDWSEGKASPKNLTTDDLDKMLASKALFARKFDVKKDPEILDLIDQRVKAMDVKEQK